MNKTKKVTGLITIVLISIILFTALADEVYAMAFATANIPVTCKISKNIPKGKHKFTYTLTADAEGSPMPKGSFNGVKTVVMEKSGRVNFGTIEYDHPDVYSYTVVETTKKFKGFKRDPNEYQAIVIVDTNGEVQIVIRNNKGEKPDKIELINKYGKDSGGSGNKGKSSTGTNGSRSYILGRTNHQTGDNVSILIFAAGAFAGALITLFAVSMRIRAGSNKKKVKEFS